MIGSIFQKLFGGGDEDSSTGRKFDFRLWTHLSVLVLLTGMCYVMSVEALFIADDIWQVNFAHNVFAGNTNLIVRNFVSNYLQIPSLDFYRPLLGLTFLYDYFIWQTNSFGYHLTNITLYTISVLLLFYLVRLMTSNWPTVNSASASFFSAALFAVSPLHCEAVTWISGRADLLCAPFYLLALILTVKSKQTGKSIYYYLALLLFVLAMFSKEIGIGLPLVVACYFFVWPVEETFSTPAEERVPEPPAEKLSRQQLHARQALERAGKKKKKKKRADYSSEPQLEEVQDVSLPGRLKLAFLKSLPFFALAGVYLAFRYQALGTIVGGYTGMIGGALDRLLWLRWFDVNYLFRALIPIPQSITRESTTLPWILGLLLAGCVAIAMFRFLAQARPWTWLIFLTVWMISTLFPLAKLWGVGQDLETSRLLFFFTMGYSILWPVLMFHPPRSKSKFDVPAVADRSLSIVSTIVISAMIVTMGFASFSTNTFWIIAGQELKAIWEQTVKVAEGLKPDERVMILGIPKDYRGAHINFNGSTFHHMLRPPFVERDLSRQVITFEPFIVGPYEVFNTTRFKTLLFHPKIKGPYVWRRMKGKLEEVKFSGDLDMPWTLPLPLAPPDEEPEQPAWRFDGRGEAKLSGGEFTIRDTRPGDSLLIDKLSLSPLRYDFLLFDMSLELNKADFRAVIPTVLSWNMNQSKGEGGNNIVLALKAQMLDKKQTLKIRTSHYWHWYTEGAIKTMKLSLPNCKQVKIKNLRLVNGQQFIPLIGLPGNKRLNNGEFIAHNEPLSLIFDGSMVPGAETVEIEVTKPNYFFDNYLKGGTQSAVNKVLAVALLRGMTTLDTRLFPEPAYYEIRLRCLNASGKPVGVWSDPLTVLKMGVGLETYIE